MLLGDYPLRKSLFANLDPLFLEFRKKEFATMPDRKRSERVNRALLELIQKEPEPCFLLAAVLAFVERIEREKILDHYTLNSFELWLNQFSGLGFEENGRVRGKIVGKWVNRSDYQVLFPIGMGKVFEGTHFVTAHKSPDLDTTIASFWGWVDAFAARVGNALHIWNLPGGPPLSQIEIEWLFRDLFGSAVFTHLAKTRTALNLTGNDLLTQKGMIRKTLSESVGSIDHERDHNAVVVVDDQGYYLGDWRNFDVESVRQVIILLSSCIRWFENALHLQLISLLAKPAIHASDVAPWLDQLFSLQIKKCEPAAEFTSKQKREVGDFLTRVIGLNEGLDASFQDLSVQLAQMGDIPFAEADELAESMRSLFDEKGRLIEKRPDIFAFLQKSVSQLHAAIFKIRTRLEQLDIALKTKEDVFGHHPTFVTVRSDVEEIRAKIGSYPYLTVAYPDQGRLFPVGVIQAQDLRKNILGTVSLRDFCNRDEMTIPSYLDVVSVIDHHKSQLNTFSPPFAIIADAQSSNALVAGQAFLINDRYTSSGQSIDQIDSQIKTIGTPKSTSSMRLLERLYKRKLSFETKGAYYVHPEREFTEYLHFLYGILDDTDLLTKVSAIDIECISSLLNRLKSIAVGKEMEIISFDDLPRDKDFIKKAAKRILQNEDMYSLYSKVYAFREKEVERTIGLAAHAEPSNFFADTKEQNGCCRVGQTKMFALNIPLFFRHADAIRRIWMEGAASVTKEKPEIDLHIHMISTIVSAQEVYKGSLHAYQHKDELWIWIPGTEGSVEHLKRFLNAFQSSAGLKNNPLEVEFLGANSEELSAIFKESFFEIPQKSMNRGLDLAILRYNPGSLNSRKAMVSPYLPTLTS